MLVPLSQELFGFLSLKLQLPEAGEPVISARLGFCLVIVLLETQEIGIVSGHLPRLAGWAVNLKQCQREDGWVFPHHHHV